MKYHPFLIFLSCVAIGLVFASSTQAALYQPFGSSKIFSMRVPGVTCAAQYGPMLMLPASIAPPGLYAIRYGTKTPTVGGQILGNYRLVPDFSTCYTNSTPPVTIPVFMVDPKNYGVSR
jgi:hypothetical protein